MSEPTTDAVHPDLPVGTVLAPEADGTPRYVCACHRERSRMARGRGVLRAVWMGGVIPLVGAALVALAVGVLVADAPPAGKAVAAGLLALLLVGSLLAGRADGHRGWCAARTAAYWFLAFPALLLGFLSAF